MGAFIIDFIENSSSNMSANKACWSCRMICLRVLLFLAFLSIHVRHLKAQTHDQDRAALNALTSEWKNLPKSWKGNDPCGQRWDGITCQNSRVITITLSSMNLEGQLTGDLVSLSQLQIFDLSYNKGMKGSIPNKIGDLSNLTNLILLGCSFSGRIPDSIGSLKQLVFLSLNSNKFTGEIPASIGNLKKLYWLDLSDNQLTGGIPVSSGNTPGLDLLTHTKHFHFGINKLTGTVPSRLFHSNMEVIHVLFDNNNLTGSIPSTLGLVQGLEAVRFDRNSLSGRLPANLNNLTSVNELVLSNNGFTGPVPDLTGMGNLNYVDLSNNTFSAADVPGWFSSLMSLTTIMMESTGLEGQLPEEFFDIPQLETVQMKNNRINGTLTIGSSFSNQLELIDLDNNSIGAVTLAPGYNFTLKLTNNPYCQQQQSGVNFPYCSSQNHADSPYSTPAVCVPAPCSSGQTSSPTCKCAYPYSGMLFFRAPSFSEYRTHYFEELQLSLLTTFGSLKLPVDSVLLSDVSMNSLGYLEMLLSIFPTGQPYFNRTGILSIGFVLSNQTFKPAKKFGPYYFIANSYRDFGESESSHKGIIIGAAIGASFLLALLLSAGGYAYHQKKRAEKAKQLANPFVSWDSQGAGGDVPQLKGAKFFSFEELQKCTNNFSEANSVGSGGYGKVYKGFLVSGQIVAIKRLQEGSLQGSREFKNEIELLSRVHHKNLVNLIGFCFDQGEQILVYEFVANGTLLDSLTGKSGIQLDWIRRLMIALGSARGLQYLHELAYPSIIHRDIKSSNILLDERLHAKVADFGLSKLFSDDDKGYVTTQVKGTMGYLDPEYFMTNQLTEKSDIFSFGVVMLEMITGRRPIQNGKYILREVKTAMNKTKDLYDLNELIDPFLLSSTNTLVGFKQFIDLALKCTDESGMNRPTTGEVVKEIENIVKLAGMNPNADSASQSQSYEQEGGRNVRHPYNDDKLFEYSGSIPLSTQ